MSAAASQLPSGVGDTPPPSKLKRTLLILAGVWVAAGLMLLETAQRYMPNRQPEITDAVLAAILTCILWGSERRGKVAATH